MSKERAESSFHIELDPLGDVRVDPEVEPSLLRVAEAALPVPPLQLRAAAVDDDAVQRTGLQPEGLQLRQDLAEPEWRKNNVDCPFSSQNSLPNWKNIDQKWGTWIGVVRGPRSGTGRPSLKRPGAKRRRRRRRRPRSRRKRQGDARCGRPIRRSCRGRSYRGWETGCDAKR